MFESHSQIICTLFGFHIYFYGVMIALGILAGVGLAVIVFKSRNLASDHILNIALICIPSAILGAIVYSSESL